MMLAMRQEHEVFGGYIAVNEARIVNGGQSLQCLARQRPKLRHRQGPALNSVGQGAAAEILEHKVTSRGIDAGFLKRSTLNHEGNFDFDADIDLDDYALIDAAYLGQTGVL